MKLTSNISVQNPTLIQRKVKHIHNGPRPVATITNLKFETSNAKPKRVVAKHIRHKKPPTILIDRKPTQPSIPKESCVHDLVPVVKNISLPSSPRQSPDDFSRTSARPRPNSPLVQL